MKRLIDASLVTDGTLDHVDQAGLTAARHRYHSALLIGKHQTAARAGPLMRKHHALARRLLAREDDYLRFTAHPRVPFDNNAAERENQDEQTPDQGIGLHAVHDRSRRVFCAIRSYLSTAAKHGIGMLDALTSAARGAAWVPETA